MHKFSIRLLFALLWLTSPLAAKAPAPILHQSQTTPAAGADSVAALAELLYLSLRNTNFEPLRPYLADRQVYDGLLQLGNAPVREALMLYTPDEMLIDLQKGFGDVIRAGMVLEVNWEQIKLQDVTFEIPADSAAGVLPVQLHLSSPGSPDFVVQFNVARFNGGYYYLPPLFIPNQDLY